MTKLKERIVAEAALEKLKGGAKLAEITPFWRVLDEKAPTTAKLSCGVAFVKARLSDDLSAVARRAKAEAIQSESAADAALFDCALRAGWIASLRSQ